MGLTAPAVSDSAVRSTQRLLKKLYRGGTDANIVVLSDSTGQSSLNYWPRRLIVQLAPRYPAWSVNLTTWDDVEMEYGTPEVIQAGSGDDTLTLWNTSVSGESFAYFQPYLKEMVCDADPDLVMIALGHNEFSLSAADVTAEGQRDKVLAMTETILSRSPRSSICLVTQNIRDDTVLRGQQQITRIDQLAGIAAMRGFGFLDVWQAFYDAGVDLTSDHVHPTSDGQALYTATVLLAFDYRPAMDIRHQAPSTFDVPVVNLLLNGGFQDFTAAVPTGWVASNATLSQDATHFESRKGYGVRIQADAAAASYITNSGSERTALANMLRGQWVTASARVRRDAGQGTTSGPLVQISTDGTGPHSDAIGFAPSAEGDDRWQWVTASARVPDDATTVTIYLWADTASNANADVTVDRIILARGILPRDEVDLNPAPPTTDPTRVDIELTFETPGNLAYTTVANGLYYLRVGNLVTFSLRLATSAFTHTTASGEFRITGFPYAPSPIECVFAASVRGYTGSRTWVTGRIETGNTYATLIASGTAAAPVDLTEADMPSGGTIDIIASGSYFV